MPVLNRAAELQDEVTQWRRHIHQNPELNYDVFKTAAFVAEKLRAFGCDEVVEGIGRTGVVGLIRGRKGDGPTIALRADMDALPIEEETNLPYRSRTPGKMHACGHDGHTTMLLGAARYLAETKNFDGTAVFVFQPAEEGLGGARAMIADGLFETFPVDEIYAIHNFPGGPHGKLMVRPGPAMAAADFFDIRITGRGAHAAQPHWGVDPIIVATQLTQAMQSIVSRNSDPLKAAVLSITQIHAGTAYNVIPESAHLAGTVRSFDAELRKLIARRIRELSKGIAEAYGASVDVDIRDVFSVLDNSAEHAAAAAEIATELFGDENVDPECKARMGSEDFADMLRTVPGAYAWLGAMPGPGLHNASFNFDDSIIPLGAAFLARMVERRSAVAG